MADVEIERKRVTLHPLDENGVVDTTVNLYPKTFKDGIVDRDGNPVNVLTDADIGHIQEEIEELSTDKQDVLVSRKNIKSINNQDILGEGNLEVGGKEPLVVDDITALTSEQIASLDIGDEIIENTSVTTKRLYIVSFSPDVISDDKYLVSVTDEHIFVVEYCNGEYDSSYEVPLYALSIGLYADEGKVLTANGNGGLEWREPETKLNVDDIENLSDEQCNALNIGDVVIEQVAQDVGSTYIVANKTSQKLILSYNDSKLLKQVIYTKSNSSSPWEYDNIISYSLDTEFAHKYTTYDDIDALDSYLVNQLELGDVVVCIPEFKNYTVTYKEGVDLYLNYTDSDMITDVYYSDGGYVDTFNVPVNILFQGLSANAGDVLTNIGPDELGWKPVSTGEPEKITWANLKTKRDNSQLVVGKQYRITDYLNSVVNKYSNQIFAVDNVKFDIIVTAIRTNALSEFASACARSNISYSYSIDFSAWKLKYCLDNDDSRFEWADTSWGKGVIYFMKDEWNNEAPYDFKNTQFLYQSSDSRFDTQHVYTFTNLYFNRQVYQYELSLQGKCRNCVIKESFDGYKYSIPFRNLFMCVDEPSTDNPNVLFENMSVGYNCHSNMFSSYCFRTMKGNKIGSSCFNITVYSDDNVFDEGCYNITILSDEEFFGHNTFGKSCNNITSVTQVGDDNFGFSYNTFGNYCNHLTLSYGCTSMIIGNYCNNITTRYDTNLYCATIGDRCNHISFSNLYVVDGSVHLNYLTIDRDCSYLSFVGTNDPETGDITISHNIHIHNDIKGTPQSYKQIEIDLELDHPVDYYANNQEDIII